MVDLKNGTGKGTEHAEQRELGSGGYWKWNGNAKKGRKTSVNGLMLFTLASSRKRTS